MLTSKDKIGSQRDGLGSQHLLPCLLPLELRDGCLQGPLAIVIQIIPTFYTLIIAYRPSQVQFVFGARQEDNPNTTDIFPGKRPIKLHQFQVTEDSQSPA